MTTRTVFRALMPALAGLLLTACGGVLESQKPARQTYLLQPPDPVAGTLAEGVTLNLAVSAVPGLDTDRILALGPDARLNPVANVRWADHLPEVMTSVIRRTLADSGQFERVNTDTLAHPGDWQLDIELQAFYGMQSGDGSISRVRLLMDAIVSCGERRERLRMNEEAPAGGSNVARLVAAHQQALDRALRSLPARLATACSG
ncbi:ABC-type transport auxiliary lipoprotein family protein [Elongatibacter sediminis]|uniref:ABC-type transport auxiliary lipoprotein family protein n=1 Tax=Elongatibacter sediminis TaxID=3119006 RepID=A0AAW9R8U9_9GAMM